MLCPCDKRVVVAGAPPRYDCVKRAGPLLVLCAALLHGWICLDIHDHPDEGTKDVAEVHASIMVACVAAFSITAVVALGIVGRVLAQLEATRCEATVSFHRRMEAICRPPSLLLVVLATATTIASLVFAILSARLTASSTLKPKKYGEYTAVVGFVIILFYSFYSCTCFLAPWFIAHMGLELDCDKRVGNSDRQLLPSDNVAPQLPRSTVNVEMGQHVEADLGTL
jgi:hypothetical protein